MAFNPSKNVGKARDYSEGHGLDGVVIVEMRDGKPFQYLSYGKNRVWCRRAETLMNIVGDRVDELFEPTPEER